LTLKPLCYHPGPSLQTNHWSGQCISTSGLGASWLLVVQSFANTNSCTQRSIDEHLITYKRLTCRGFLHEEATHKHFYASGLSGLLAHDYHQCASSWHCGEFALNVCLVNPWVEPPMCFADAFDAQCLAQDLLLASSALTPLIPAAEPKRKPVGPRPGGLGGTRKGNKPHRNLRKKGFSVSDSSRR
jgi:hypothetical protein